ncbi:hypothetical protein D3C80_780500 [compost metagenome]
MIAQILGHASDAVDAGAVGQVIEIGVARVLDGVVHVHRAVPAALPAAEGAPAVAIAAGADHPFLRIDAGGQEGQGRRHLKGRAGRESAVDRLVQQRLALIIGQRAIDFGRHARDEQIGIERRRRHHGQDVAVAHVHDHTAAGLLAEDLQRALLDVVVQRQHDLRPLHRRARSGDVLGHDAAASVHLDAVAASDAAQIQIKRLFNALTADAEAGVEQDRRRVLAPIADGLDVAIRHLGHIADHMGVGAAMGIVAGLVHVGHDAGQVGGVQIDPGELLPGQVALDRHRREARGRVDLADDGAAALQGVGQQLPQQVQGLIQVLGLVAHDQDPEAGPVAGDDDAVAVLDQATRRRDQAEVELVVGCEGGVLLGLDHLKLGQAAGQGGDPQRRPAAQQQGAAQEGALPLIDVGKEDGRFAAHRKRTSASSNRSISQSASGNSSRVGITCPATASTLGALPTSISVTA